ncbi:MAG TPA: hypothetical protein VK502_03615 [Candidatus Saccharimonadales bacterium]|nr:hypothetical protein [Candidatus Saccharimonadales bacterium]
MSKFTDRQVYVEKGDEMELREVRTEEIVLVNVRGDLVFDDPETGEVVTWRMPAKLQPFFRNQCTRRFHCVTEEVGRYTKVSGVCIDNQLILLP